MSIDITERNRQFFNSISSQYDDLDQNAKAHIPVVQKAAEIVLSKYDFDATRTTVLDYACGTGLMSHHLAPFSKEIIGVDLSEKMVEQFNAKAQASEITRDKLRAVALPEAGEALAGKQFDVVVCVAAYHHIEDVIGTTNKLRDYLRPGGMLFVLDMLHFDHHAIAAEHGHKVPNFDVHTIAHGGFSEDDMKKLFADAGLQDFDFTLGATWTMHEVSTQTFVASGRKPE